MLTCTVLYAFILFIMLNPIPAVDELMEVRYRYMSSYQWCYMRLLPWPSLGTHFWLNLPLISPLSHSNYRKVKVWTVEFPRDQSWDPYSTQCIVFLANSSLKIWFFLKVVILPITNNHMILYKCQWLAEILSAHPVSLPSLRLRPFPTTGASHSSSLF